MKYQWFAFLSALTATLLAGALAFAHFSDASLPGCGQGHACDELSNGVWGNVAGLPVAFLGTAWFAALAFVLLPEAKSSVSKSVFWTAVSGLPASIVFAGVMIAEGKLCPYCAGVHAANLLMCGFVWLSVRRDITEAQPVSEEGAAMAAPAMSMNREFGWLKTFVPVFVVAMAGLMFLEYRRHDQLQTEDDRAIQDTVQQILAKADVPADESEISGRHMHGADDATWRIVIFHDYCCADCRSLHRYVPRLLEGREDISVSYRHLPLCAECNPNFPDSHGHDQACQAARLAEAAADLHGHEGFERLSNWLFKHRGEFTDAQLAATLEQWNWPVDELLQLSESQDSRTRVSADVQYGTDEGVRITPTVFINGVLLQGKTSTSGRLASVFARVLP